MKRFIIILNIFLFSLFLLGGSVLNAADINDYVNPMGESIPGGGTGAIETVAQNVVGSIANSFISKVMGIIGILVLCMFVWSGLQYIMARGDSKKIGPANETMKWSVIGLVIVFTSYIVINFVFTIIGQLGKA